MTKPPLTLSEQLAVCQQVAQLVRRKLPISGELTRGVERANRVDSAAHRVDKELMAGKSLTEAIAADRSRDSRTLSACIEVGERSGHLSQTLEAWTAMQLACAGYSRRLRGAMLYPLLLIVVMLCSLGVVVWRLIPEYRMTYAQFDARLPGWLEVLATVREHTGWLLGGLLLAILTPLGWWFYRRCGVDRWGLPLERAARAQTQALAAELLQVGVSSGIPLSRIMAWSVQASGGDTHDAEQAFARLQQQQPIPGLSREANMLIAALHAGLISSSEAVEQLGELARFLRQQADDLAATSSQWLPMMVALIVGGLTLLTYVCLIYLPWILLLQKIVTPH